MTRLTLLFLAACTHEPPDVPSPADGPLTTEVDVPATAYWVNAGMYLRTGDVVQVQAEGAWTMWDGAYPTTGPEGMEGDLDGCPPGSLVGSVGLHWGDDVLCLGAGGELTAPRDGILYLKAHDYGLEDNAGTVRATLTGEVASTPTVAADDVADHPWHLETAGTVELQADHVVLSLPRDLVLAHADEAADALATFDAWWEQHRQFSGTAPYGGQAIRYVVDDQIRDLGAWMLSGNPIRLDSRSIAGDPPDAHILRAHDPAHSVWGYAHEMAHDFSFARGGAFMIGEGPIEAWANLWTVSTLEAMGHPEADRSGCDDREAHLADGTWDDLKADPWLPLCMLMEIRDAQGGWDFYRDFFRAYADLPPEDLPAMDASDAARWGFVRDLMNEVGSDDVTPVLQAWHVPLP